MLRLQETRAEMERQMEEAEKEKEEAALRAAAETPKVMSGRMATPARYTPRRMGL
jgi:hypothetical protein